MEDLARKSCRDEADIILLDVCNNLRTEMEHRKMDPSLYGELNSFENAPKLYQELRKWVSAGYRFFPSERKFK